jgi:hypothetical protein
VRPSEFSRARASDGSREARRAGQPGAVVTEFADKCGGRDGPDSGKLGCIRWSGCSSAATPGGRVRMLDLEGDASA